MFEILLKHNELIFKGEFKTIDLPQIIKQINNIKINNDMLVLNMLFVQHCDSNILWFLKKWINQIPQKVSVINLSERFENIWKDMKIYDSLCQSMVKKTNIFSLLIYKKNMFINSWRLFLEMFIYKTLSNKQQFRLMVNNFFANVYEMGLKAIPVVSFISFFLGIVIAFQGAYQMKQFAAELFVVDFLALSIFRELGPIITGIIFASRTGSAITAQIGTMKNNDEMDMIFIMGLNPKKLILLPKLLALVFISPFITLYCCLMSMLGGLLIFTLYLGYSVKLYINFFQLSLGNGSFWMFAWKGPLFAFIIGVIACAQGLQVQKNPVDLGVKTTAAVVAGLISVLFIDGIISVLTTMV